MHDEIMALLTGGGLLSPPNKHLVLARTLLGCAIGSLAIDAGLSDERILQSCELMLKQIRAAASDPEVIENLQAAARAARAAHTASKRTR